MIPSHANKRILVVDGDLVFRYAAFRALDGAGFEVVSTGDYFDALSVIDDKRQTIDLLLTAVVLPTGNGYALARMARTRRRGLRCAYTADDDAPTSEAVGPVIRKPVSWDDFAAEIRSALDMADSGGLSPGLHSGGATA